MILKKGGEERIANANKDIPKVLARDGNRQINQTPTKVPIGKK